LAVRLDVSLNPDGTIKASALPVGTFDARSRRVLTVASVAADPDSAQILSTDSLVIVDTTDGDVTVILPSSATAASTPTVINIGLTGYSAIVDCVGADTVMGLASYSIGTAGESHTFGLGPSSNWWVV
jgi:hypothetical protein